MRVELNLRAVKTSEVEHLLQVDLEDPQQRKDLRELVEMACSDGMEFYQRVEGFEPCPDPLEDSHEISLGVDDAEWPPQVKAFFDRCGGDEAYKLLALLDLLDATCKEDALDG